MCGICGFSTIGFNKNQLPKKLDAMTEILQHRGPDEQGSFLENGIGLGFRRLSIIDLNNGSQPQTNEDNSVIIVFNGEIYNYRELRVDLQKRGHRFRTESDTEVIIHLYEDYGFDCLKRLRGMFSFVIYDCKKQILFGARDYFGIKPMYYYHQENTLLFASEIKSILAFGIKREVNQEALFHYLTFQYVPDPLTMFKDIYKLPPGHYFIYQNNNLKIKKYWQISFAEEDKPISYFIDGTRELLKESVQKHSISDVPLGAFLSSGIDSTAIVSLLKQQGPINTYTVGFDVPGYNEIAVARETARQLGTIHKDEVIDSRKYFSILPELIWYQDEPVADPSAIALYFVAKLAKKDIKVVLSGEGADEIFGGYNIYKEPSDLKFFTYLPDYLKKRINEWARLLPEMKGKNFLLRGTKDLQERFYGNAMIFPETEKIIFRGLEKFANSKMASNMFTNPLYQRATNYEDSTKMQFVDLNLWLPGNILSKADKMTMANSLELRVPFLDKNVFEFARTIPAKYKIYKGVTKFILREAMKGIVPESILYRRKLGFPVPIRVWLKAEYFEIVWEVISNAGIDYLLDKKIIQELMMEHRAGKKDNSRKIWTIFIFAIWYQAYFEGASFNRNFSRKGVEKC